MPQKPKPLCSSRIQRVVMYCSDNAQILDVTGPLEVFSRSSRWLVEHGYSNIPPYSIEIVADQAGLVTCSPGITLHAQRRFSDVADADIVLVAGGIGHNAAPSNPHFLEWLRAQESNAARLASVSSGSHILAAAGLLKHRSATTHWSQYNALSQFSPLTFVNKEPKSAGSLSSIDLALNMVAEDWGPQVVLAVAQELEMVTVRRSTDLQKSRPIPALHLETQRIRKVVLWILDNLDADLSVPALAQRAAMSMRNFSRRFHEETGLPPGKFVDDLRFTAARRQFELTAFSARRIASACGFGSAAALRRAFARRRIPFPMTLRRKAAQGLIRESTDNDT